MESGVLEPLCSLARSEDVEIEIQRFAVLAIANLASSTENHPIFIEEVTFQVDCICNGVYILIFLFCILRVCCHC